MKKSITQAVIDAYADFFEHHRGVILLFVVGITLTSIYGLTRLTINDDFVKLFVTRSGDFDAGDDIGARTDQAMFVMLEADDLFTPESLAVIWNTHERMKGVEGIERVVSLYDLRSPKKIGRRRTFSSVIPPPDAGVERISAAKKQAMQHPLAREQLLSKDGKETLMTLEIDPRWSSTSQLRTLLKDVRQLLAKTTEGTPVKASLTGVPVIRVEVVDANIRDELTFNIVGPLIALMIAYVIFRRVAAVLIVMAGAALGVLWTIGSLGLIGEPLNPLNSVLAPLALTIGLTDSIHMLMHIRSDQAKGADQCHAAVSSIRTVGFPSSLTSLTSAVGFASLGIAQLKPLAIFGYCSAVAVMLAFLSVMTVVPLLVSSFLGNHIEALGKPTFDRQVSRTKWHTHLATFVVDHRVAMLIASFLVTGWALYVGAQIKADPRIANGLPTNGETVLAFRKIEREFGGSLPLVAMVQWSDAIHPSASQVYAAIAAAHHALEGKSIIGPPLSLVNVYQSMPDRDRKPQSLFQQLSQVPEGQLKMVFDRDSRRAMIIARCQDAGGHPVDDLLTEIENEFTELETNHPGFRFRVVKTVLGAVRDSNMVVADLTKSMLMAVPLTLAVVMIGLRSFHAGVIALMPNVFPMAALAATMVCFGQSITLTGAAVFVMCFGIAVDDTIHAITAFGRNREAGQSVRDAIINAYRELGDALVSTTAILIGGLGVVLLGQSYFIRMFGLMFCLGLFWALIGDLVMLPAVLACYPHKDTPKTASPPDVAQPPKSNGPAND